MLGFLAMVTTPHLQSTEHAHNNYTDFQQFDEQATVTEVGKKVPHSVSSL